MKRARARAAAGLAVCLVLVSAAPTAALEIGEHAEDDALLLDGFEAAMALKRSAAADPALALVRYTRAPMCNVTTGGGTEMGDGDEQF
ncbi:hypothetical protein, partial [Cellulomonas biazotea]